MTYEAIPAELKDRITAAAQELYEQADCQRFPTVDAVRRHAKADMNSTSAVMREWRKAASALRRGSMFDVMEQQRCYAAG